MNIITEYVRKIAIYIKSKILYIGFTKILNFISSVVKISKKQNKATIKKSNPNFMLIISKAANA